jgi:Tfp pilus assembly protein PilF
MYNFPSRFASSKRCLQLVLISFLAVIFAQCGGDPKSSDEYVEDGLEYTRQQEYRQAISAFSSAIELEPENVSAHYGLGGIYNAIQQLEMAEQSFQTVIKLDPTHYNGLYSLGFTYELMGQEEKAKSYYERSNLLKKKWQEVLKNKPKKS